MARSLVLAALSGLWTLSDGREERRPCPGAGAYTDGEPLRLPRGCEVGRAGVWTSPALFVRQAGEVGALREELAQVKAQRDAALEAQRETLAQLREELEAHTRELELLRALCAPVAPEPCAVWTPRAEGAGVAAAVCGALYLGAQIR
ncbi:MAG: hypothetical protein FJ138_02515 [Deltaproteobacteria bacterium]|nr:hypothetical protein [Deltaproteobacteria bacterium]